MSEWNPITLGECCDILDNQRVPINSIGRAEIEGEVPYYGANGIQGYVNDFIFNEPLILIAEDGGYFDEFQTRPIAYRVHGKSWVNNHAHVLRAKPKYIQDFIFYSLQHKNITPFIKGGTRAKLNQSELKQVEFLCPVSQHEQAVIAKILEAAHDAIEKTKSLIAKYQQIKAGLMHDLFTRGVTANGKLRPPREQAPELYQETPVGWIPREWEVSGLKERAVPGTPHLRTGPFGSSLKGEHWVDEGHPVITIGALGEGIFIKSELLYVGNADAKRLRDFQLKEGEVVFSRVADVGRSIVIREEQIGWIMSSNLMRISLDRKRVIPEILQQQLAFDDRLKRQIKAKVNSGGRDVANSEILNQLLFVWPTYIEQQLMVERATAIDCQLRSEEGELEKLEKQKMGLMHDLLTGKVSVLQ